MKIILSKGKYLTVTLHKEIEVGDEADVADELIKIAMGGYREFAGHLNNPREVWLEIRNKFLKKIDKELININNYEQSKNGENT